MNDTVNIRGPRDNVAGIEIPGYRITATLGEGGMGTVYEAQQDAPRRKVAIKVLHARSGPALARFTAEADIMARLDHPGIARVLEAGDAEGSPFLVMEHVDGKTLDRFTKDLPRRERLELFVQLCDAVHHAHVHGVIHRDLKPANVMVTSAGRVVVLDFGVARLAAGSSADTREGELVGTPMYMSPEQASLRADQVDARTDVYTLGVILYELACGEFPYDLRELSVPAITVVVTETTPLPLGKRDEALRGDLEAIAGKALEKEPARRYQSVAALRDDVRHYLDGLPVSVRSPTVVERAGRFVRRRPLVAAAIAAGVVASAAFTGAVTYLWLDATEARRDAEAAGARTEAARAQLEARTTELTLRTARAALARDPTEAIAWLATLGDRVDADAAWAIWDQAIALGVAQAVERAHSDEVHWIEPIERGFVTAGYDGRVIMWDPKPHAIFTTGKGRAHIVAPTRDGHEFAVGGDDGALHVIDASGRVLATLEGHAGDVQHVAWEHDGMWLASGDDHGKIFVWPHGRAPGKQLETGPAAIGAVATGGRLLVAGDHDGNVWAWDVAAGTRAAASTKADIAQIWTDAIYVRAIDANGTVWQWHVAGSELALDARVDTHVAVKRAVFAKDGTWAMLGGVGGAVVRVEGTKIEPLGMHRAQVRSLAISADGHRVADGGDDGSLVVRDLRTGRAQALRGHAGRIRHLAFAGDTLLSSDSDGVVRQWSLAALDKSFEADAQAIDHVAASADGTLLAAVDAAGDVSVWDAKTRARTHVGHADGRTVALAIAGTTAVTGTTEGAVTWWLPAPRVQKIAGTVKSIAVGNHHVAVATSIGPIAMFSLDGTVEPVLAGNAGGTEIVAFDPTGTLLASGGQDRAVRVWRDGQLLAALDGPTGDTGQIAFSPDGDLLVAGGNDGTVRAWRVNRGEVDPKAIVVTQHTGAVSALAIDRGWLVSAGRDAKVTRAPIANAAIGAVESATLPAGATRVVVDDTGAVHALLRTGAVARWSAGGVPVVTIEHGARDVARARGEPAWAVAFDDGTLLALPLAPRTLPALRELLAGATTYRLR